MVCRKSCFAVLLLSALVQVGCQREAAPPSQQRSPADATAAGAPAPRVELKDVMETGDGYIIGISYPSSASNYPGLAAALIAYADEARAELMRAVRESADDPARPGPYDLSLNFVELHASPQLVVVAADGSSYTGGAHGTPLVKRFVWLPQQGRMLTATELMAGSRAWPALSAYAREQLHAALSMRVDADELPPAERAELVESATTMIDDGTAPMPSNFDQFEPVVGSDGRIQALRFVFPPYQVGPYAAGTQTVEVPAGIVLPHVAREYRALFAGG